MRKIVKQSIIKQAFWAMFIALIPLAVSATGLGKLYVFSALGEPLNAEIELLSVPPEDMTTLTASLAPQAQYLAQGIDKTTIQESINANISKRPDGSLVIQLTSGQAVTDPFLDMLIQVVWSGGQLTREYTLLLDPSDYSATNIAKPIAEIPKSISPSSSAKESLPAEKESASKSKSSFSGRRAHAQKTMDTPLQGQTITTVKGDTLSALVGKIQVQDVNLDQLLLGVYQANPSAFTDGNMNRLKVGKIINIPSAETLQAISKSEARAEVTAQVANWHGYATKLAEASAHSEATENSANQLAGGKIIAKAEDKAAPATEGSRDVIKLTKTETDQSKPSDLNAHDDANHSEKTASNIQDDLAAKENENKDADERSAVLQKQISDMKHLLMLRNKHLADTQNKAKKVDTNNNDFPISLSDIDPIILAVSGGLITLLLSLFWISRRKNKRALSNDETIDLNGKTLSSLAAENSADLPISLGSESEVLASDFKNVDLMEEQISFNVPVEVSNQSAEEISFDLPDSPHDLSSDLELQSSANKPLEMDLTDISLDFESAPQLTAADYEVAPIPDAFNGDFSNMLKINVKPKSDKVAPASPISKSVSKPIKSSKRSKDDQVNNEESADVATKLELAAAYIDMEDKEGAFKLLTEAIKEGGPEQRARAQKLIDRLN
jgi:pilus assembly protein FimV